MPSPWRLIIESMFCVLSKEREIVPFQLLPAQAQLDAAFTGRDLVPKARQLGISTYIIARFVAKCLTRENLRCVIISHEEEATKRLLATAQFILSHLRSPQEGVTVESDTTRQTQAEIVFRATNSWFYIGTAGSRAFGRGDTITDLHCSEYAWWPDETLFQGLLGSVPPSGEIVLESTGNGIGNDFEQRAMKAARGESRWHLHFFPWYKANEYRRAISAAEQRQLREEVDTQRQQAKDRDVRPPDEVRLVDDFELGLDQLAWRRDQIDDFGGDVVTFKQEFPTTLDECFQTAGGAIFRDINYRPGPQWETVLFPGGGEGRLAGHPRPEYTYIAGIDSAAGVRMSEKDPHDNSVIQVGCLETGEQVLRWHSGRLPPDALGLEAAKIGTQYNEALLVFESNNHGLTALAALRKSDYPRHKIYKRKSPDPKHPERGLVDYGYATTSKTKPLAVGRLRVLLKDGFVIYDDLTYRELLGFVETEAGKLEGQQGTHDDFVMALVMLAAGWQKAGYEVEGKHEAQEQAAQRAQDIIRQRSRLPVDVVFDRIDRHRRKGVSIPWQSRDKLSRRPFFGGNLL